MNDEQYASVYSQKITDDLDERQLVYEAYLAGMRQKERNLLS